MCIFQPHEQFVKQHEAHRKLQRVTINNNVAQSHCYPNYSGEVCRPVNYYQDTR